jgi:hypothetical protein
MAMKTTSATYFNRRLPQLVRVRALLLAALLLLGVGFDTTVADTITLVPVADTALFEQAPDNNLGGLSDVPAGTTRLLKRGRGLFKFDLSGIPPNATITSAAFTIHVVKEPASGSASTFELHRVLKDWGEGTGAKPTQGSPATSGQATWNNRFHPSTPWSPAGGGSGFDYVAAFSATAFIDTPGSYTFQTTTGLVADVQAWVKNPATNFGWMLISQSEGTPKTARRLGTRENANNSPALVLSFFPPPSIAITNPIGGATFAAGTDIPVQATASGGSGVITEVDFFANGTLFGSATTPPYSASLHNAAAANYSLSAVAVDSLGAASTSAVVNVTVQASNLPPFVAITNPVNSQVFIQGQNVLIEADASDADGSVAQVEFFTNGISAGVITTQPYSLLLSNLVVGPYVLTAVATDNLGANATSAPVTISVITPPQLPTILIAPRSQTSTVGSNVFFSVSAGGTAPLYYQWQFNGTDVPGATLPSLALVNVQTNNAGAYTVIVTNVAGAVTSPPAILTVVLPPNIPPQVAITNPVAGAKFPAGASVIITADASDPDGTVVQVQFLVRTNVGATNSIGITTAAPFSVILSNLPAGTNFLSARATDNRGGVTTSAEVAIFGQNPPTAALTLSATNFSVQLGTDITLSATTASVGGSVTNVALFDGASLLASSPTSTIVFLWHPTDAGEHSVTAVATDDLGQKDASAPMTIRIFAPLPFSALAGTYTGVFFDAYTNNIRLENSGLFSLQFTKRGPFTGKLAMNGATYRFRGQFDEFGKITLPVVRRALAPVVLVLQLDLSGDTGQITGTATTAAGTTELTSDLLAERNVFNARTNPAPQAGRHPFILHLAPDLQGQGVGLIQTRITPAGVVRLHGALNDGQKFNLTTTLSKAGYAPFYVSLSRGDEAIVGRLHFGTAPSGPDSSVLWQISSVPNQTRTQLQITPAAQ